MNGDVRGPYFHLLLYTLRQDFNEFGQKVPDFGPARPRSGGKNTEKHRKTRPPAD